MIACEQGRVDLDDVFGKEAKGIVAHLNTEGHHRGAVAAARALAADEVHIRQYSYFVEDSDSLPMLFNYTDRRPGKWLHAGCRLTLLWGFAGDDLLFCC